MSRHFFFSYRFQRKFQAKFIYQHTKPEGGQAEISYIMPTTRQAMNQPKAGQTEN